MSQPHAPGAIPRLISDGRVAVPGARPARSARRGPAQDETAT